MNKVTRAKYVKVMDRYRVLQAIRKQDCGIHESELVINCGMPIRQVRIHIKKLTELGKVACGGGYARSLHNTTN